MKTFFLLLKFLKPFWSEILVSILLGIGTIAAGIGLLGTSAYLISAAALHPSIAQLEVAIVGVRFFGISRAGLRYGERLVSHSVNLRLVAALRSWFYERLINNDLKVTAIFRSGDLLDRMLNHLETLENFYVRVISPYIVFAIITLSASLFVGQYSPIIGWILAGGLVVTGVLIPLLNYLFTSLYSKDSIRQYSALSSSIVETLDGLEELTAFGSNSLSIDHISHESNLLAGTRQKISIWNGLASGLTVLASGLTIWFLLRAAISLVQGDILSGILLAVVVQIGMASFESVNPLADAGLKLEQSIEAGKNIFAFDMQKDNHKEDLGGGFELTFDSIRMSEVSYTPGDNEFTLQDISLDLQPGKKIALVGPSGAGKSSIIELLLKICVPDSGKITAGTVDFSLIPANQVRSQIGVIGHGDFLFNTSLKENLRIAKPQATDESLWNVLGGVGLGDWAAKLPEKLNTWLGNHGTAVSGGEFQRLMLARLILMNRPILLMDEPLTHLDQKIKQEFFSMVNSHLSKRAILWVSHELLFMEKMDEILYMEEGCILERGSHRQLMSKKERYFQAYSMQMGIEM